MHDVLDLRDIVPDEAEQLLHSGFPAGDLLAEARAAAARSDLTRLADIARRLATLEQTAGWPHVEYDDAHRLTELSRTAPTMTPMPDLRDRVRGAWLGRCIGNTMGKPVEGLTRDEVSTYLRTVGQYPQTSYLPMLDSLPAGVSHLHESAPYASAGRFVDVPRDDDLDWTILGLWMLEEYGPAITGDEIARSWLDRVPFTQTFTAERATYRNLVRGIPVSRAAEVENPYREWIGALIRADIFGYVFPGDPGRAARATLPDALLSHRQNGVYGEMWAAALVSAAFACDSATAALEAARAVVPDTSRLARALDGIMTVHAGGSDSAGALDWLDANLGFYNWVHTINNAVLICIGLLWGDDFRSSVALAISGGLDTDSTGATVGSIYGALHGARSIPDDLVGTTHRRVRSAVRDFDRVEIDELAARTVRLAESLTGR